MVSVKKITRPRKSEAGIGGGGYFEPQSAAASSGGIINILYYYRFVNLSQ
jgi:hypothetical protein